VAEKTFQCRLVTPSEQLLSEPVAYASVPAWDGLFGVLPGRAPILAKLGTGELTLEFPGGGGGRGGRRSYAIDGGFVQMSGNLLSILAERAVPAEKLVEGEVESDLRAAEGKAAGETKDKGAAQRLTRERDWARVRLRVARGAKSRGI
jgi:F-type H+-transporting ATPase subunit epsilon